jgi:uncharacterized small protein (DUF1192 family)
MSLLKNILRPFVDFNETDGVQSVKEQRTEEPVKKNEPVIRDVKTQVDSQPVQNNATVSVNATATAGVTTYQQHFEELIEEANAKNPLFQGTDLKEFIDSKVDVESIADEGARYKTAFNVLKRTGLTKERLIKTGQQYIAIIENDLKGFENAFAQQYKKDVEQVEQVLEQKNLELKTLNERIATLTQEIKQISATVAENKNRMNTNKSAFILAGENKKKELQAELEKINQYFL